MKKLYTLLFSIIITSAVFSQTTHNVSVLSNNSFDPDTLTIDEGDMVIWTNTGGFHNVNGNTSVFPDNPVSFGNEPSGDLWTYQFTFDTEGNYDYLCDIHAGQMRGRVIVQGVTSTDNESKKILRAFPIPAHDFIVINGLEELQGQVRLEIFDITGKKAMETLVSANEQIDIRVLNSGIYLFNVTTNNNERFTGKIVAQ